MVPHDRCNKEHALFHSAKGQWELQRPARALIQTTEISDEARQLGLLAVWIFPTELYAPRISPHPPASSSTPGLKQALHARIRSHCHKLRRRFTLRSLETARHLRGACSSN